MEEKIVAEGKEEAVTSPAEPVETAVEEKVELNSNPVPETEVETESEAPVEAEPVLEDTAIPGVEEKPALFTQEQLSEKIGSTRVETREKTFKYVYDRYGVENEEQLDELFGNAQRYDTLKEQYDSERAERAQADKVRDDELMGLKEQVALMQSGIDHERFEDAKLILKGKGLEVSLENIQNELATHPEWKKVESSVTEKPFVKKENPEPVSKISVLGNSKGANNVAPELDERAQARKLFDM